jgi:DNA-directed RNA polymerase specialized sigma24 family protein
LEALALRSPVDSAPAAEPLSGVARAAAGDVRAFEDLYRTHLPRVHALVRRMTGGRDAEELTQDVFVRAWHPSPPGCTAWR